MSETRIAIFSAVITAAAMMYIVYDTRYAQAKCELTHSANVCYVAIR